MDRKYLLAVLLLAIAISFETPVRAERTFYSVASLTVVCAGGGDLSCKAYLSGVVEAWYLKDVVGVRPYRFQSGALGPPFCEMILKVSEEDLVNIVRSNLKFMKPGFAADAVMDVLSKKLCK